MKKRYLSLLIICLLSTGGLVSIVAQSKTPIVSLSEAKRAFNKGNYSYALPTFMRLVSKPVKDASLYYYAGACCYETGDWSHSELYLKKAYDKKIPGSSRYLAKLYYDQRKLKELLPIIEEAMEEKIPAHEVDRMDSIRRKADAYSLMLKNVDGIEVVDSVVVDKDEFIHAYKLSKESGSLYSFADFFRRKPQSTIMGYCSVYENEKQNRIVYSKPNAQGAINLYSAYKVDGRYEEGEPLPGSINSPVYNESFPYLLSDGMTIYFSSDNPEGLGGYDIYVSRYSFSAESYLVPESMGMPYNSVYNDYLLAIDEVNHLGWFASDRYQSEGKVVIYIFNALSERAPIADPQRAIDIAELRSIKLTQKKDVDYSERRVLIKRLAMGADDENHQIFSYVIDDQISYHSLDDFHSQEAKKYYKLYLQELKKYNTQKQILDKLREEYRLATSEEEKVTIGFKIIQCEETIEAHDYLLQNAEILPRNKELDYLKR